MRFSHALAAVLLSSFAFACGEGEPAVPERGPSPQPPPTAVPGSEGSPRSPGATATGSTMAPNGQPSSGTPSSPTPSSTPSPIQLTEQGAVGQALFQEHCASCHGAFVNVTSFDTAADVLGYVSTNMPRGAPGSLSGSEYFSIVAFDLAENGVDLKGQTLDASNAPTIRVH